MLCLHPTTEILKVPFFNHLSLLCLKPNHCRCIQQASGAQKKTSYSTANTPNLRSTPWINGGASHYNTGVNDGAVTAAILPNYMAASESAKARVRSQTAPRQSRPSTPKREQSMAAKKRSSYPVLEPYMSNSFSQNLRSPSFKSVQAGRVGIGQQSCYTDSISGEISPSLTTDLRRWLR